MVDTYVKCVAVFFIPLHFVNALRNGIQGMGYGLLPMLAGVAELAGRGITAMIAAAHKSYFGACMASPMAWGACRRTSDHHVFLCDEGYETQTWPVKIRKITRDLPKKTFFGDIYLQTVIKNEKKVNSRCKIGRIML